MESVWWTPTQSEPQFGMCIVVWWIQCVLIVLVFSLHQSRPLDVLQCVKEACARGHLCLTIPWVVQYLSMVDSLALHTDYYKTLLCNLINIYRCVCT